jgi:ABC-2 type transport system permease protein
MMRSLITRTLYEKRWFVAGWALVFAVMTTLVLMFYPSFSEGPGIEELSKTVPQQLQGLIGDPDQYKTIDGFIASQIYDIRMPLLIMIMGLVLAAGLTIREEENGELRTLSALNISRTRLLLEKWVAGGIIITVLNLVAVAGTYVGIASLSETMPHELIWRLMLQSSLFGIVAFTIPFAVGIGTGKRAPTMFIGLVMTIGSFLLTTFAKAVDWLKDWEVLSLVHYYDTEALRDGHFNRLDLWVLSLIGLLALCVAILAFRRRDISG